MDKKQTNPDQVINRGIGILCALLGGVAILILHAFESTVLSWPELASVFLWVSLPAKSDHDMDRPKDYGKALIILF